MNTKQPCDISAEELNNWLKKDAGKPLLIDVREPNEIEIAPFSSNVMHLPLSEASSWAKTLPEKLPKNQAVVVLCHAGIRSRHFCNWLLEEDLLKEVWNLDGGIDAWSVNVDPNVPRY